jgi:O-succinylbenzoic acid--CoA ligase
VAVVADGTEWTYRTLDAEVSRWTDRLAAGGVGPGDRVAHLSPNSASTVALTHALWRMGASTVPLNTRLAPAEISGLLELVDPRLVLVDPSFPDHLFLQSVGARPWSPSSRAGQTEVVAAILFTSGTTGRARAAALSRGNFIAAVRASAANLGVRPEDRWLLCLPLFHVGGLTMLHRCAFSGIALHVHPRFDAVAVSADIDRRAITHVSLVATALQRLLKVRAGRRFPGTLQAMLVGGGPVGPDLLAQARALGAPVLQTYGLTEACAQVATERPSEADGLTAGPPLPGLSVRIVDSQGEDVPVGQVGEIEVCGPTVMLGYFHDESETHQTLWKGWLRTRDLGSLDERGRLTVVARRQDLILSGGENVYPAEVEAVLAAAPGVEEAAVIGVPDPEWGQVPVAAVVGGLSEKSILDHCRARLAGYKVPKQVYRVAELPRNAGGKVDRAALRRRLGLPDL